MTHEEIKDKIKLQIIDNAENLADYCIKCGEEGTGYDKFFMVLQDLGEHICDTVEWDMYPDRYGGPDAWDEDAWEDNYTGR